MIYYSNKEESNNGKAKRASESTKSVEPWPSAAKESAGSNGHSRLTAVASLVNIKANGVTTEEVSPFYCFI